MIEITCPDLPDPENGLIEFSSNGDPPYDVGVLADYSCNPGYSLQYGDERRTCEVEDSSESGIWSGTSPQCVGKLLNVSVVDS